MENDVLKNIPAGRLLAIDFGQQRIGLAMSDPFQMLPSPLKTVQNKGLSNSIIEILTTCKENNIVTMIVGMPLNMNGTAGETARHVKNFTDALTAKTNIPVLFWDERWTTVSAEKSLIEKGKSPSKSRDRIDQIAAAFLLQSFMDRLSYFKKNQVI